MISELVKPVRSAIPFSSVIKLLVWSKLYIATPEIGSFKFLSITVIVCAFKKYVDKTNNNDKQCLIMKKLDLKFVMILVVLVIPNATRSTTTLF